MYSQWITQITQDNLDFVVEYNARYGKFSREEITQQMQSNAANGQDSYLLVYNPENPASAELHIVDGKEVQERYFLIPVYHPEGHLQEFVNND
jgi:hypothetical protein